MADPQSAGGTASLSQSSLISSPSLAALDSSPSVSSPLTTCTSTVTVYSGCTTTISVAASASPKVSVVGGPSPASSQIQSSSTSALTSGTSVPSSTVDSTSVQLSSALQGQASTVSSSPFTSTTDFVSSSSATSTASAAVPTVVTTSSSSPPAPLIGGSSPTSSTDGSSGGQTAQQDGPADVTAVSTASDDGSGAIATSGADALPTSTISFTMLGTIMDPGAGSSSTAASPSPSSSVGGSNNTNNASGTMNSSSATAESAASKRAVIAGAVVGGILGFLLLIAAFLFFLRRRNQRARASASQPMQKYFDARGSVLGYGPDPFDRSTGIESVRTAADAFRGPGMIQHVSPAPSVHSARSIVQKLSRPGASQTPPVDQLGQAVGGATQTPRSWVTFQQQRSPLRNSSGSSTAGGAGLSPQSLGIASPAVSDIPYPLFRPPAMAAPVSGSPPGPENFTTTRSSKASSSVYSYTDSGGSGGVAYGYDTRRRSLADSVDPFRDAAAAPDTHSGLYSPLGRAL
ncbi:hypothetical protein DAEQUDRAFT_348418 [Daedalea quercina L-15889]|uniref:Epidermal growth factor receptor-like transmembrane-juxtamembrane segment domain-containing protein n=1 Tax=Daedalea quercina L-15889 TaxID=1314783 RepID=A0A165PD90_9APHY|nr:hypothetical protein DAEQUDRAFT_348418 [Daedalea quercina L-15889]